MQGKFSEAFSRVENVLSSLGQHLGLNVGEFREIEQLMRLMFAGSLWGLENLNQILASRGIKSDSLYKHWRIFTHKQIEELVNELFLQEIGSILLEKATKSDATWSRAAISFVGDISIFAQWLSTETGIAGREYFAKYYSGQHHTTVYGWRVFLLGMVVDGTFYPMYFRIMAKKDCEKGVAVELLEKASVYLADLQAKNSAINIPNLFCGFDSGFHDKTLLEKAEKAGFTPICVAKSNHIVIENGKKYKINQYIERVFDKLESEAKDTSGTFLLRKRLFYQSLEREVVMLFFRLKGSKKVSVIYSTNLNMSAKTLRRRWFGRTQIEQFFRMMKDTLKIQHTKSVDKDSFCNNSPLRFLFSNNP